MFSFIRSFGKDLVARLSDAAGSLGAPLEVLGAPASPADSSLSSSPDILTRPPLLQPIHSAGEKTPSQDSRFDNQAPIETTAPVVPLNHLQPVSPSGMDKSSTPTPSAEATLKHATPLPTAGRITTFPLVIHLAQEISSASPIVGQSLAPRPASIIAVPACPGPATMRNTQRNPCRAAGRPLEAADFISKFGGRPTTRCSFCREFDRERYKARRERKAEAKRAIASEPITSTRSSARGWSTGVELKHCDPTLSSSNVMMSAFVPRPFIFDRPSEQSQKPRRGQGSASPLIAAPVPLGNDQRFGPPPASAIISGMPQKVVYEPGHHSVNGIVFPSAAGTSCSGCDSDGRCYASRLLGPDDFVNSRGQSSAMCCFCSTECNRRTWQYPGYFDERIAGLSSNSLNPPSHHTWSPSLLPPFEPHLSRLAYSDLLTPIEAVTGQTHELLPPMFDIASIAPLVFDPASVEPPSPHGPSAASTRYPSSLPVGKRPAYTSPTVAARKKMKPSPPSPSVRSTASYTLASDPSLALSPFPRLLTDAELVPATHPWQGYSPVKADDTRSDFGVTSSSDRPERLAPPRSKRSKVLPLGAAASNVRSSVSDCAGTDRADTPVSQARFSSVSQVTNCTLDATPSTDKAVTIAVENLARATSGLLEGLPLLPHSIAGVHRLLAATEKARATLASALIVDKDERSDRSELEDHRQVNLTDRLRMLQSFDEQDRPGRSAVDEFSLWALKRSLLRAPSDVSSATTIIDRCFPTGAGDQVEPTTRVLRAVSFELVKEAALYALRHPTRLPSANEVSAGILGLPQVTLQSQSETMMCEVLRIWAKRVQACTHDAIHLRGA